MIDELGDAEFIVKLALYVREDMSLRSSANFLAALLRVAFVAPSPVERGCLPAHCRACMDEQVSLVAHDYLVQLVKVRSRAPI